MRRNREAGIYEKAETDRQRFGKTKERKKEREIKIQRDRDSEIQIFGETKERETDTQRETNI